MESAPAEGTETRRGVGLVGVRERVSRLDGTIRLETRADKGTRLTIELPVAIGEMSISDTTATATAAPAVLQERG